MFVLWTVVGIAMTLAGLIDVFLTVLHFEASGPIAVRSYRWFWEGGRHLSQLLPTKARPGARSLVAPLMVVLTLVLWLGSQVIGFAFVYYPAITSGRFAVGKVGRSLASSLYFSAATLSSLSFSDVEPTTLAYHVAATIETLVGLGVLTLAITYVLNLYRVLQEQGAHATTLSHRSHGSNDPLKLLEAHFVDGHVIDLGAEVRYMHANLISYHEGVRRYPLAWYFHTRRPYRSLPYIFWATASVAAALRWASPPGHPASEDPWLSGLTFGFNDVMGQMSEQFLPRPLAPPASPVPLAEFQRRSSGQEGLGGQDGELLTRFLEVEARMHQMTRRPVAPPGEERYDRYKMWLEFTSRARSFVELASRDLGLDVKLMYEDPMRTQRW